jgi:hypothetical protein
VVINLSYTSFVKRDDNIRKRGVHEGRSPYFKNHFPFPLILKGRGIKGDRLQLVKDDIG